MDDSVSPLSPLFINDISTHHEYQCSPATQTQPVEKHLGAEQCFWHCQGAEDTSPSKIFPWSPTYIERDSPLPSPLAVALGQRPILLYFIFSPPPTTKTTCQCLQQGDRYIYIYVERIFCFNLEVNQKHCQRQNGLRARVLFQSSSINENRENYPWPSICYHFSTKLKHDFSIYPPHQPESNQLTLNNTSHCWIQLGTG